MGIMVSDLLVRVRADMGNSMGSIGLLSHGLTGIAAIAGVAVAGAFVKMGMDAQTQLAIVAGLTGSTAAQMTYYTTQLEAMGAKFGETLSESAQGLYFVVSAGYQGADAVNVLTTAMQHSAATGVPLQDVTRGLTASMNSYAAKASEATTYSDILTMAIKDGVQTTADFAGNVSKAALMAASAHVPFTQLAAAEAALTHAGEPANRAFTELSFMISKIAVPSADAMAKSVEKLGGHLDATKYQSADLMGKLLLLRNSTGLNEDAFLKLVGGTRSARGALGLLSDGGVTYRKILADMANSSGATAAAFEVHTKTMAFGFQRVGAAVSNAAYNFVQFISPAVVPFLGRVAEAITQVTLHVEHFAPLIGGVAVAAVTLLAIATWNLAAAVIGATWPVLAVAAAIGIVVAGLIFAYQHWAGFRDVVNAVGKEMGLFFKGVGVLIGEFQVWWRDHWNTISEVLHIVWDLIAGYVRLGWSLLYGIIRIGLDVLTGNWGAAWQHLHEMLGGIWASIQQMTQGAIGRLVNGIIAWMQALPGQLQSMGIRMMESFISGIMSMGGRVAGALGSVIHDAINSIPGGAGLAHLAHLPGFAYGGTVPGMIGEPQLVIAHGGEQIIPVGGSTQQSGGGSSAVVQHITVMLDTAVLTRAVLRGLPAQARLATGQRI